MVKELNVVPVRIFDGFRMTYRREVFAKEIFEPLFLYYAVLEDSDLSYCVSRHGTLAMPSMLACIITRVDLVGFQWCRSPRSEASIWLSASAGTPTICAVIARYSIVSSST